ncbi:hypothetical protein DAEQUDRAFT_731795 [Daedalea quercina L-15889]|uniref:PPPDE domain-containing protein n=1 Tax=Daedalea quercina L-15889 TaxID=1314783 RepID=A0A165LZY8_9APHY|nr:hypothetical protein DAEQUDRAFT_731795 [Daedalea quercina L-15889]
MSTLCLLGFYQSPLFPSGTAHWGLYLYSPGERSGTLYHVSKESIVGATKYDRQRFTPTISQSLRQSVEVASGLALDEGTLNLVCARLAHNRPFDLVVNNCQRYCTEVLVELVRNGTLTQAQFDALSRKGFTPLIGQMQGQGRLAW